MKLTSATVTHQGGRSKNQDCIAFFWSEKQQTGYWMVADGLGGHEGGEVASSTACNAIQECLQQHLTEPLDQLDLAIETAHQAIHKTQQASASLADMRTTVVLLAIAKEQARWTHCGDTRLYHFKDNELSGQTLDDSVPQALVNMGEIAPSDIRQHEDRSRLTRCLGSPGSIKATLSQPIKLGTGDCFLLCSDGFWEYVTEPEMLVDLAKATSCEDWLDRMRHRVETHATGDHDNYTAITIWIEEA